MNGFTMTTNTLAEHTELTTGRIRQLAPQIHRAGLAHKTPGRGEWFFKPEAIRWIRLRKWKHPIQTD